MRVDVWRGRLFPRTLYAVMWLRGRRYVFDGRSFPPKAYRSGVTDDTGWSLCIEIRGLIATISSN